MKPEKIRKVAALFRQNGRMKLSRMSRSTGIAVSTLFDWVRNPAALGIRRFCALVDFPSLGFFTCATILFKADKEKREELKKYLLKSQSVNSLMRINNGYDFLAECVFRDMRELEEFCELLERQYKVRGKEVHFTVEELKREDFFSDPKFAVRGVKNGRA
jgi:DNA-binding Lrp family transcriptional regulator